MKFICEINSTTETIEELKGCTITKRIESDTPSKLLSALRFTNGTRTETPTTEQLLVHLFEKKSAYAGRNYTIFMSNN